MRTKRRTRRRRTRRRMRTRRRRTRRGKRRRGEEEEEEEDEDKEDDEDEEDEEKDKDEEGGTGRRRGPGAVRGGWGGAVRDLGGSWTSVDTLQLTSSTFSGGVTLTGGTALSEPLSLK
ncbi:hypothetical protein NL108_017095 [Boleophthalmus pectinirostris]|nr:hypothetical protein NL108_017095 [Boleophthalmus pectinirostris]